MDNPETLAPWINVRENRRDNQELTIQRQTTWINVRENEEAITKGQSRDTDNIKYQDTGRRQTTTKHNTENWKDEQDDGPTNIPVWTQVLAKRKKFLPLNLIQRMIRTKGSLSLYSSPGYSCIILHFMTIRFLFLFQEVNNVLVGGELRFLIH
jgi:hypothetical protein